MSNNHICSICQEELDNTRIYTPCIHGYHDNCIKTYITTQITNYKELVCPDCRTDIKDLVIDMGYDVSYLNNGNVPNNNFNNLMDLIGMFRDHNQFLFNAERSPNLPSTINFSINPNNNELHQSRENDIGIIDNTFHRFINPEYAHAQFNQDIRNIFNQGRTNSISISRNQEDDPILHNIYERIARIRRNQENYMDMANEMLNNHTNRENPNERMRQAIQERVNEMRNRANRESPNEIYLLPTRSRNIRNSFLPRNLQESKTIPTLDNMSINPDDRDMLIMFGSNLPANNPELIRQNGYENENKSNVNSQQVTENKNEVKNQQVTEITDTYNDLDTILSNIRRNSSRSSEMNNENELENTSSSENAILLLLYGILRIRELVNRQ